MAASKRPVPSSRRVTARDRQAEDVNEFMRTLDHPKLAEIDAVRWIIMGASTTIGEGIKWNAPSFHVGEYFATIHLKTRDCVHVIFHRGAKVRKEAAAKVADPTALLHALGPDRAEIKFGDMKDIQAKKRATTEVVRAWIATL